MQGFWWQDRDRRSRLDGFELESFKLVQQHATSEQWREWLRVPLEHAAAMANMDLFTRLMDAGADGGADWRGCHGRTLLGAAAAGNSEEMVLALLKAGAKDDVTVRFGAKKESALHVAAAHGSVGVTNALMLAGANPNILDNNKQSPLHLAAEAGHGGVVNTLLLKGADPNVRTEREGQTPLHLAAAKGRTVCVSMLVVGGADKESRNRKGYSPLHLAARNDHLGAVEKLLAAGADFDVRGELFYPSRSALDMAVKGGHVDVVRALLRHGSSLSSSDQNGYTALHYAADEVDGPDSDNGDVIRVLLEAGADMKAETAGGSTPLHVAASAGSSGSIRALLEGGATVSSRNAHGSTPLHDACSRPYPDADVVEALLCWGADEKLTDKFGRTAEETLELDERDEDFEENSDEEDQQRRADSQRIRYMLDRAPADRSWRRRGWLVLACSCPAKVQLAQDINVGDSGSSYGSAAKTAKTSHSGGDRDRGETFDLARLVGRVVNLDAEGVFRLVVGFL